jgi:hypothetical protein
LPRLTRVPEQAGLPLNLISDAVTVAERRPKDVDEPC